MFYSLVYAYVAKRLKTVGGRGKDVSRGFLSRTPYVRVTRFTHNSHNSLVNSKQVSGERGREEVYYRQSPLYTTDAVEFKTFHKDSAKQTTRQGGGFSPY